MSLPRILRLTKPACRAADIGERNQAWLLILGSARLALH